MWFSVRGIFLPKVVNELLLTRGKFHQACEFVRNHARILDKKLLEYHFENGSKNEVLRALAKYQNPDGGFGNAIEPDFRLEASSPMATSVGLQYCVEIEVDPEDIIVQSAIKYLVSTYQSDGGFWPFAFMDVNEEPHAPWWHADEITSPPEAKWPNPNAELVGYLNKYATHVPEEARSLVNRRVLLNLDSSKYIEGLLYNVICWNRACHYLPESLGMKAEDKIERTLRRISPLNEETLREIRIFSLAPDPESIMYRLFPDTVHVFLDSEIERQSDDGGWWPTWEWGQYEAVWSIAKEEWAGKITVQCLKALKEYNLIETT